MPVPSDFDICRPCSSQDHRVDVHVRERQLAGELDAHHHHPGDPEEDDVARRRVHVGRVERRAARASPRASRASRTATAPSENQVSSTSGSRVSCPPQAPQRSGSCSATIRLVAVVAVPDRDLVAPPELARDAPGPDVLEPVEVHLGPAASPGWKRRLPVPRGRDRGLGQALHVAEPLQRDQRLDPRGPSAARTARRARTAGCRRSARPRAARRPRPRAPRRPSARRSARPAASVMRPSSPIALISSRPCLRPISKSFGSCPGVIFSAPVPNSGST